MKMHQAILGVLTALMMSGGAAMAASVTFTTFGTTNNGNGGEPLVTPLIIASDETPGKITVSIGIDPLSAGVGDLQAVWFDFDPSLALFQFDFPDADADGDDIVNVLATGGNVNNLGSGDNLNGGFSNGAISGQTDGFDVGFNFNSAHDDVKPNNGIDLSGGPFVFSFVDTGPGLAGLTRVGFRFQDVTFGGGSGLSDKVITAGSSSPVAPIPLPAAAWMLLGGLGALSALARRRAA